MQEVSHFIFKEEILPIVDWLVANSYGRHVAKRPGMAGNKDVWSVQKVAVDICDGDFFPAIIDNACILLYKTEADDDTVYMGEPSGLIAPFEGPVGKIDMDAFLEERLPEDGCLFSLGY